MKRAFQYVTHYGSANQEFADASVRRYEQKGVLRAGVPSPSPQSPSPFSLPPYPLPPTPFDACYAGYNRWRHNVVRTKTRAGTRAAGECVTDVHILTSSVNP